MTKPLFVTWCPKDVLDGTQTLGPWEELAYRRILDLIYATDDNLPDDPRKLGWMTKVGGRWKQVRETLIATGKIQVVDGRITNARCARELQKSRKKIAQKVAAGHASAEARKSLEDNETGATDVGTDEPTHAPTNYRTKKLPNQQPSPSPDGDGAAASPLVLPDNPSLPAEERFWRLKPQAEKAGISASLMGKAASQIGDYDDALDLLLTSLGKQVPRTYLTAVLRKRQAETQAIAAAMTGIPSAEPEFVRAARRDGTYVERLEGGNWRIGSVICDQVGNDVGW